MEKEKDFVEIYRGNLWEAEIVKGLLASAGIESMIKDETLAAVTSPYLNFGGEVLVMVNQKDKDSAVEMVEHRKQSL